MLRSLYEDDLDSKSTCSSSSQLGDSLRFDVDLEMDVHVEGEDEYPMMLPLSLPSSPKVDLETNIANGLEGLRSRASVLPTPDDVSPSPSLILKSEWSSSTIGSIREEHKRRGSSAKFRLYFGGGGKRARKNSKVIPQAPMSMKSPIRTSYAMKSRHGRHSSREPDIIINIYGRGNEVRRRGSVTPMISEAGSDDSVLGSNRSGLRRMLILLLVLHGDLIVDVGGSA